MTTEQTHNPVASARAGASGVAAYFELAQRQLETNLRMATTWAAAISAVSGSLLTQPQLAGRTNGPETADGRQQANGANPIFGLLGGGDLAAERPSTPYWTPSGSRTVSLPRWLNEPPTVQPDLFDEAIELLIDDDIKTAS